MDNLNSAYVSEQNKIAAAGAWIWLVEIATTGYGTLRYTNNNAVGSGSQYYTTWNGYQYWTMAMAIDDVAVSTSGEFPEYKVMFEDMDIGGTFRARVKATGGLVGSTIRLMVVHTDHLALTVPAVDEMAEVLGCEVTPRAVTLTVGIPSLLSRRFPRDRYVPAFCRHIFGGAMCQYRQSTYEFTSDRIQFVAGVSGEAGIQYNSIVALDGGLIDNVFAFADGEMQGAQYLLERDTGFSVSGSLYNDGFFLANKYHAVDDGGVRVFMEADGGQPFYPEAAGASVTIRLGYTGCDHTLDACKLRDNTQNFGGSPGIAGGIYG